MIKRSSELNLILIFIFFTLTIQSCKKEIKETKQEDIVHESNVSIDWPEELDAVIAAPKNHKVLMENDKVRVLEVTVLPNEIEALHHHQWPSVLHLTETGDFIRRDGDGNIIVDSRNFTKEQVLPMTIWKEPQKAHYIENLSDSLSIKLIRVELKQ